MAMATTLVIYAAMIVAGPLAARRSLPTLTLAAAFDVRAPVIRATRDYSQWSNHFRHTIATTSIRNAAVGSVDLNAANPNARTSSTSNSKLMQDVLYRVRSVNFMPDDIKSSLIDFCVDGIKLGKVRPNNAKLLCSIQGPKGSVFSLEWNNDDSTPSSEVSSTSALSQPILTLTKAAGADYDSRTAAVATIMTRLKEDNVVTGWRNELYPIAHSFYDAPLFAMERAAVSFLGALEYGVHINGLLLQQPPPQQSSAKEAIAASEASSTSEPLMWMARRSLTKSKYPGMLDHIAAGGQPVGLSLTENVVKECWEEAGIPPDWSRSRVRPAGAVSYMRYAANKDVVERCVLFCYDLYLPADFQPKPIDGEVEEFFLYTIDQLLESMDPACPDPIKPNCYSVIIDFLLRHGHLSPELPGYLDVLRELRSGDCQ